MWDIEGRIADTKTYSVDIYGNKMIAPGEPIHDMHVRITVDDDYVIREAVALTNASPYACCAEINPSYAKLVGLKLTTGFTAALRERFGGPAGCTHITELLSPMATTAFQTIAAGRLRRDHGKPRRSGSGEESRFWNACYALRADGEVARRFRDRQADEEKGTGMDPAT
jgi:hypothetical protein